MGQTNGNYYCKQFTHSDLFTDHIDADLTESNHLSSVKLINYHNHVIKDLVDFLTNGPETG